MQNNHFIALQAQSLPDDFGAGDAPEWIHLTPVGKIETLDGRGPYLIEDPQAVIEASFAARGDLEVDINHASFIAAPRGGEAPAQGWIKEMRVQDNGIWGRVEWTAEGRRRVASREYRRISPVFLPDRLGGKRVVAIANASLVNRQNLRGMVALNFQEDGMMPLNDRLAELFGLGADVSEDDVFGAVSAMHAEMGAGGVAEVQSQLGEIATVLGVEAGGDVVAAARTLRAADGVDVVALQSQLVDVTGQLNDLEATGRRTAAEAFIDGAIRECRVGVSAQRDRFVSMHMENPESTEALVGGFPKLGDSGTSILPPDVQAGDVALNAEHVAAANLLGMSHETYADQLKADRAKRGVN